MIRFINVAVLWRLIVSVACLSLGYGAVLVTRCRSVSLAWPLDNPFFWGCSESGSGVVSGSVASAGMLAVAALILVVVWLPVVRRHSYGSGVMSSLSENLDRAARQRADALAYRGLPAADHNAIRDAAVRASEAETQNQRHTVRRTSTNESTQPSFDASPAEAPIGNGLVTSISGLRARVDMIEESLVSESLSPKEAMREWIGLLKDCNDAYNNEQLPSSIFKDLNTRLLDLFTLPSRSDTENRTPDDQEPHRSPTATPQNPPITA